MKKIILQALKIMNEIYSSLNPKFNLHIKIFLPVLFSLFISINGEAQEIISLDGSQSKSAVSTIQKLTENGENNAYFMNGNQINTTLSNPLGIETDLISLNQIFQFNSSLKSAEVLIIHLKNISDLNNTIDLSKAAELKNLKYIYIVSEFNTTPNQLKNKLINIPTSVVTYYSISIAQ
ncbi:hypothetical protein [Flavobacterium sp. '19STA2R22 D10 B1']|uniref:hypothetical protein n=1 Tax=Flavobacterium aerium TaxID=3037261 RepID=UPI00278C702B|nr:hypothetical protein [Flavobacterium sp. '19STA2R22 D10 B1']